ncbi:CPBP family glutamic-type intramembrane protease [Actinomycetospora endophytica]|uniref:CPBP family glutamic-type intramembrane protease n=1 Tax=Actinomycetospora endophytica TaxID=2291215 RepID=A0ABS8PBY0_9PSEU|nr:CPBP family glutamic-type intramembrane protease [Actinomycetospora endophytica]MCD2195790.1 CPBP family glutamic-type intramembrane protease [Actinomycetospora endophytica]
MFAVRLVNPLDGPLGEEPGWRGFALPGLQARLSPLAATAIAILAVVVTVWHLPLVLIAHSVEGSIQPSGPILIYTGVWVAVAVGLLVLDRQRWRGEAPAEARTTWAVAAAARR